MRVKLSVIWLLTLAVILPAPPGGQPVASAAADPCAFVKAGTKVMWGKNELTPRQIARVTILQKTPLFFNGREQKDYGSVSEAGSEIKIVVQIDSRNQNTNI